MLFLLCQAGGYHFGIDIHNVVEVLPRVRFQVPAGSQPWLAGVFSHNGQPTPVIDLPFLVGGKPCPLVWSSRIVLVSLDNASGTQRFGLLMERVETAQLAGRPGENQIPAPGLPAWGPVVLHEGTLVQFLDLSRLLVQERPQSLLAAAGATEGL
jgi:chemotaxis-related protein WspB